MLLNPNGGFVGINIAIPAALLHILGPPDQLSFEDNRVYSTPPDVRISFNGQYNSSEDIVGFSQLRGGKNNTTDENMDGYFSFWTRKDGVGMAERVRIDPDGNVGMAMTAFGTNAAKILGLANATAPSSSPANITQVYSDDFAGGHACLHIRNEDGDLIKLEQQNKADYNNWTDFGDVVDALVAMGILDQA